MAVKIKQEAQNPLILRSHRLMEAFAKSDDERDFYLDRQEGFIIYVDLDKAQGDLEALQTELVKQKERYCMIPKLTFYETKKIMEGFVTEKVYDIDTKEKLLDIIQSKDARSNFLEFLFDHHAELDKWQQYYQERSRIRIIEWLRNNHFHFVFEEDLELASSLVEKLKRSLFETKVGKDIAATRKLLIIKAKTYYSNEALNPRPKRGRPPKQAVKQEVEHQNTTDIYTTVAPSVHPFLFIPDINASSALTFSSKFEVQEPLHRRLDSESSLESINQKLAALRGLSSRWIKSEPVKGISDFDLDEDEDNDDEDFDEEETITKKSKKSKGRLSSKTASKGTKKNKKQPLKSTTKPKAKSTTAAKAKPKAKSAIPAKVKPKSKVAAKPTKVTSSRRAMPRPVIKTKAKGGETSTPSKKNKRIIPVTKPKPKAAVIKAKAPPKKIIKKK